MLCIWFCIYFPLFRISNYSINEYLFLTPGYLWYLSSMLFAILPFCLIKRRLVKYSFAAILLFVGTFFGENYQWISGGGTGLYWKIFISTRNGLFFTFPLMCIGEMVWKTRRSIYNLIIASILTIVEISYTGLHVSDNADRSMYFLLPILILFFLAFIKEWNPQIRKVSLAGYSSAIYLMQYGLICIGQKILRILGLINLCWNWIIYIWVLIVPVVFYNLLQNKRISKIIF